tara:strand:- start:1433 stop:1693 length:261 start_codon:yes stop_codon:yes gene_type:complete
MEKFYLMPEFKKAFLGTTIARANMQTVAVYDFEKCLKIIMDKDKLPYDEAVETLYFNTINADLGDKTPIIIQKHSLKEMEGWDFDE